MCSTSVHIRYPICPSTKEGPYYFDLKHKPLYIKRMKLCAPPFDLIVSKRKYFRRPKYNIFDNIYIKFANIMFENDLIR